MIPQLIYVLIVSVPSRTKKNPSLAGKKRVAIFGSTEGESSDDSLVDLVSAEGRSLAELPKYCFYHKLVFQRNAVFGRESHVTFYEMDLLPPRQLATFCKELIFELLKRRKIEVLGRMVSPLEGLGCALAISLPQMK